MKQVQIFSEIVDYKVLRFTGSWDCLVVMITGTSPLLILMAVMLVTIRAVIGTSHTINFSELFTLLYKVCKRNQNSLTKSRKVSQQHQKWFVFVFRTNVKRFILKANRRKRTSWRILSTTCRWFNKKIAQDEHVFIPLFRIGVFRKKISFERWSRTASNVFMIQCWIHNRIAGNGDEVHQLLHVVSSSTTFCPNYLYIDEVSIVNSDPFQIFTSMCYYSTNHQI